MEEKLNIALAENKVKIPTKPPTSKLKDGLKKYKSLILLTGLNVLLSLGLIWLFSTSEFFLKDYIMFQLGHCFLTLLNMIFIIKILDKNPKEKTFWYHLVGLFILSLILYVVVAFGFTKFKLPSEFMLSTLMQLVPMGLLLSFQFLISIPKKIFKPWYYPYGKEIPIVEVINPVKVNFYLAKNKDDEEYSQFSLNVPRKYKIGEFMHYFIHRYNYDKNPESPIYISDDNTNQDLYGWLFRRKPNSLKDSEIINPDKSFIEENFAEDDKIIVERYRPEDIVPKSDSLKAITKVLEDE